MKYLLIITIISLLHSKGCDRQQQDTTAQESKDKIASTETKDNQTAKTNAPFLLIKATYENWIAGIPTGGSGTEYYITMSINTEGLEFDSAWIDNKVFPTYVSRNRPGITSEPVKYTKNDTITLRISYINMPNQPTSPTSKPPIQYQGAVLIAYELNNERDYFVIKELEKTKSINRQ